MWIRRHIAVDLHCAVSLILRLSYLPADLSLQFEIKLKMFLDFLKGLVMGLYIGYYPSSVREKIFNVMIYKLTIDLKFLMSRYCILTIDIALKIHCSSPQIYSHWLVYYCWAVILWTWLYE